MLANCLNWELYLWHVICGSCVFFTKSLRHTAFGVGTPLLQCLRWRMVKMSTGKLFDLV